MEATNGTIGVGDKVMVTARFNNWTPDGYNSGVVKELDVGNCYGPKGKVLVKFGNGKSFVYLPSDLTIIRI